MSAGAVFTLAAAGGLAVCFAAVLIWNLSTNAAEVGDGEAKAEPEAPSDPAYNAPDGQRFSAYGVASAALVTAGAILCGWAALMSVSVESGVYAERIINAGLVADRQACATIGAAALIAGWFGLAPRRP